MDTSRIYTHTKFANYFTKPSMGNSQSNALNNQIERIDADDLIKDFKILNIDNFVSYLKDLWKDLAERSDNISLGINKIVFSKFFELPGIIFERLFAVLDTNSNEYLDLEEFIEGMTTLFSENYVKLVNFIFRLYDFNKDGIISKEDVRVVLSYVPLKIDKSKITETIPFHKIEYKAVIESQEELQNLINKCFQDNEYIDLKQFTHAVENIGSEIFLYILVFLLEKRPFSRNTLNEYENRNKKTIKVTKNVNVNKNRYMIASPCLNSLFSPSTSLKRSPFMKNKQNENQAVNKHADLLRKLGGLGSNTIQANNAKNILSKYSASNKPQVNMPSDKSLSIVASIATNSTANTNMSFKPNFPPSDSTFSSEQESMQVDENVLIKNIPVFRKKRNNLRSLDTVEYYPSNPLVKKESKSFVTTIAEETVLPAFKFNFNKQIQNTLLKNEMYSLQNDKLNINNFQSIEDDSDEECEEMKYEGTLYKISRGKKLKKKYFKLIHKDLYHYRNKGDPTHLGMHNLSGVFIEESLPLQLNEFYFYSFSLIFQSKTRFYYCDNEEEYKIWLKNLRKITGYSNLTETYEVKEKLGEGKFGLVRLGVDKKTKKKVAIKIIRKSEMTIQDMELVKTEIEILKICNHPYIIHLYNVYENPHYIYLIMEYCEGGDLFSYVEKRKFKLPEHKAATFVQKILTAVYYLHSFGIVHRDLKPENIMMTSQGDDSDIRILDFGLSKILGPNETCTEPFGTLSYVAPEVLMENPYNKLVDIWSIGIIAYLLLTGCLPFDDEHSGKEVVRKTINDPVPFPRYLWQNLSFEAKEFILSMLQKDPNHRISLKNALDHPWIQKFNYYKTSEVKKKIKELQLSAFKIYSSPDIK